MRIWRRIRELLNRVNREQGGVPRFRGKVLHRIVHYAKGFRESGPALSGDTSYNALELVSMAEVLLPPKNVGGSFVFDGGSGMGSHTTGVWYGIVGGRGHD